MTLFWIKFGIIVAAIAAIFGSGYYVRDLSCKAAAAKIVIADLKTQAKAGREAGEQDVKIATQDADALRKLDETTNDTVSKIAPGDCLSPADVDGLRSIFR